MNSLNCLGTKCPILYNFSPVRFARKPRWVPMAKSKMYKIVEPHEICPIEIDEMKNLTVHYNIYSKSLWEFQRQVYEQEMEVKASRAQQISEEGELQKMLEATQRDNEMVRALREKELPAEWEALKEDILKRKEILEQKELEKMEEAQIKVEQEIERVKLAIKPEELDAVIDRALSQESDYNFAIDDSGNIYKGRRTSEPVGSNVNSPNSSGDSKKESNLSPPT